MGGTAGGSRGMGRCSGITRVSLGISGFGVGEVWDGGGGGEDGGGRGWEVGGEVEGGGWWG